MVVRSHERHIVLVGVLRSLHGQSVIGPGKPGACVLDLIVAPSCGVVRTTTGLCIRPPRVRKMLSQARNFASRKAVSTTASPVFNCNGAVISSTCHALHDFNPCNKVTRTFAIERSPKGKHAVVPIFTNMREPRLAHSTRYATSTATNMYCRFRESQFRIADAVDDQLVDRPIASTDGLTTRSTSIPSCPRTLLRMVAFRPMRNLSALPPALRRDGQLRQVLRQDPAGMNRVLSGIVRSY